MENAHRRLRRLERGLPTLFTLCDHAAMQLRRTFVRGLAVLLIGILAFAPLAVSAAGTMAVADGQAMSSDMAMESSDMAMDSALAAADEMPCHHKDRSDTGKDCPFMAICIALCCQGITVSHATFATPAHSASRMLPPELARLDGISLPPPSRPPKA
jgi:hypothetical protein